MLVNPDPIRYPGAASTAGGTSTSTGASTDQATAWLQQQPWYKATLAKWGNPKTLSLGQRGYLSRTAYQAGLDSGLMVQPDGSVGPITSTADKMMMMAGLAAVGGGVGLAAMSGAGAAAGGGGAGIADLGAVSPAEFGGAASAIPAAGGVAGAADAAYGAPGAFGSQAADVSSAGAAGSTPDWLSAARDVGGALSSLSAGQAQGRNLDNISNIGFANAQNNLYNSELAAPGKIAGNAVRGVILSIARDVSMAAPSDIPVPQISGGLRPSMFSDTTRQLGKNITANAAATPMPTATPPVLQPMEKAGTGSNILNTASVLANLAGPSYKIGQAIPWGSIFG
jgi:hypothetical protein